MTNGRAKGSKGENDVAKLLKDWWGEYESGDFKRTPGSGGWRHSMGIREKMRMAGDLMTDAESFPFTVEVKRVESWSEEVLAKGGASPVWKWWAQVCRDAGEEKGEPMLWFRKNRMPWQLMLRHRYLRRLKLLPHLWNVAGGSGAPGKEEKLQIYTEIVRSMNRLPHLPVRVSWLVFRTVRPRIFAKGRR